MASPRQVPDPCPLCGVDVSIWGRLHTCRPRSAATTPARADHLANTSNPDMANADSMANDTPAPGRNRASPTYRYRNPDKRRLYMRDLMRRKRATGRAA
jgi:hypothetical protein